MMRAAVLNRVVTAPPGSGTEAVAPRDAGSTFTLPPRPIVVRAAGNGRGSSRESLCADCGGKPARGGAIN